MVRVYFGLGSNIDWYKYIWVVFFELWNWFGDLIVLFVYESELIGFKGSFFFNLVVGIEILLVVGVL